MKKYGEVIGAEKRKAVIRMYKEKNGELYPASLTVTAADHAGSVVGDMVAVDFNVPAFLATTLLGYLLPFIMVALAFFIISPVTDNILIIEAVLLSILVITYIGASFVSSLPFFKKITVCTVLEKIELE